MHSPITFHAGILINRMRLAACVGPATKASVVLRQLDLFRRPVEPEDLERDLRREPLMLEGDLPSSHLPSVDEQDSVWQRFGLGPVVDIPRNLRWRYEVKEREL